MYQVSGEQVHPLFTSGHVRGLSVSKIESVVFPKSSHTKIFKNINVICHGHERRYYASFLDDMAQRLGIKNTDPRIFIRYEYAGWQEALKVLDVARGGPLQRASSQFYDDKDFGDLKGRMLFNGKPLPGCRVKIVLLNKWGWNIMGGFKEGIKFETVTGESGVYHFKKVPSGGYKLYWKPPTESSWIRKLKMQPDIFIEVGETHYLPDREANVRTIN